MISPADQAFMEEQQRLIAQAQASNEMSQFSSAQQAMDVQQNEANTIRDQLDLSEELNTIEHLLRGHILEQQKDGNRLWVEPEDKELVILTDYGIYLIMNTIMFYMNKNTLLSNYEEEVINKKMEDFATELDDVIFMEYEKVFRYPTFEECKEVLMERIKRKTDLRKFALELMGKKVDEVGIKEELIQQLEGKIDDEISKIRQNIIKGKTKRFSIIIRMVQDAVHSTYLRAWKGQERKTLRQHIHISENINQNDSMPRQGSKMNPMNWGR